MCKETTEFRRKEKDIHTGAERQKVPDSIKAENVYAALSECRASVQQGYEIQVALNDKLIFPSGEAKDDTPKPDRVASSHLIPGWFDLIRDITGLVRETGALQERLLSHL